LKKLLSTAVLSLSLLILLIPAPNSYAGVGSTIVFSEDFETGPIPPEFVSVNPASENIEGTQGYSGLGFDDNFLRNTSGLPDGPEAVNPTTLRLENLDCHTSVDINFYLAIIDSWDGIGSPANVGPDSFTVTVDAQVPFGQIFQSALGTQTYENPGTAITLAFKQVLGFNGQWLDSAYNLGLDSSLDGIPHTSNSLTIAWGTGNVNFQGGPDESWAIDNVEIILNGIDDPSCVTPPPPPPRPVGGEFLPIETTSLLLAAASSPAAWLTSFTVTALGIGVYVFTRNSNNMRNIKVILRDYLDRL